MDTRPKHELKTSGGHALILNDYITGAEHRRIRALYGVEFSKPEAERRNGIDIDMAGDDLAFELVVISVDGSVQDIPKLVTALPLLDFKEVVEAVKEITDPKKK